MGLYLANMFNILRVGGYSESGQGL